MTTTMFSVPDVHCGHCKSALEGALAPSEGIDAAEVDLGTKTVTVSYDPEQIGLPVLIEIIEGQGYDVDGFEEAS